MRKYMPVVLATLLAYARAVQAADTVETWEKGAGDLDVFMVMEGVGEQESAQAVAGDIVVGWGLADRFSAYLGTTMQADGYLMNGGTELGLGIFGTPVETRHLDLDLFLDLRSGGEGMSAMQVEPAFELNWDVRPDQSTWGLYLRGAVAVVGRASPDKAAGAERLADIGMTIGSYWSIAPGRQLLIEYDATWHDHPDDGPCREIGGVALGYNVFLHDTLELLNEVRVDLPQADEQTSIGFSVGLIATLPAGGS